MTRTLLCLALLCPALAHADDDVGVVVTGDAVLQPQLHSELEGWLSKHGHKLVAAPLEADAVNALMDCFVLEDDGCVRGVIDKRSKAQSIVFARADVAPGTEGAHSVTIVAYWLSRGRQTIAERRVCDKCNDESLRANTDELIAALASAGQVGAGHLRLRTNPAGAKVEIDGQPVGVTPLAQELPPGAHKVAVVLAGERNETRDVAIKAGETTSLELELEPSEPSHPSRVLPLVLVGVGGAALVTGGVLILADKSTDTSPSAGREITRTLVPGIFTALGGAAVAGVGIYMLMHRSETSAPVAAVTSGGAYLGWMGRF